MAIGLYIHIPFCLKKCNYCDFVSYPLSDKEVVGYVQTLEKEMALYIEFLGNKERELETLYLGGGTPTCLSTKQLRHIIESSRKFFQWLPNIEVTVEANPGTIDLEKLQMLKDVGVNRLSIGAQSFHPQHLRQMGRQHGVGEIEEAVKMARKVGFANLGIDLIYGLPQQTLINWQETLAKVFLLEPEHLSAYGLKIEQGTPWGTLEAAGKIVAADDELARLMYDEVRHQCLRYGYRHYEISNFAKPGYESYHNSRYWLTKPYLGLGVAASSCLFDKRWTNVASLESYQASVNLGKAPIETVVDLDRKDQMSEMILLGLRLVEGIRLKEFHERFGLELRDVFSQQVEKFSALGLVMIQDGRLRLTPSGLPVANEVFQAFV